MDQSEKDKKIEKYKEALKILLDDSILNNNINSSIDRHVDSKKETNLDSDCIIINYAKNINELNKEDYNSIKKQDMYKKYNKVEKYVKKGGLIYGVTNTAMGIASMLWLL